MSTSWKKGRGTLGFMTPLLGRWVAQAESEMGPVRCTRVFENFGASYIRLEATWEFGGAPAKPPRKGSDSAAADPQHYREIALIGKGDDGQVGFWSFTSDGKRSHGTVTDVTDVHPAAVGFEAVMPAGIARMVYWPAEDGGFHWCVESKTKKGWRRFVEHRYVRA